VSRTANIQLVHQQGQGGDKLRLRTWIEVQLIGEDDKPIPGETYAITLPGGKVLTGTLDDNGVARIDGISAGNCLVSFPNLDKEAWTPL
jgi:hypothetical protein